MEDFINRTHPAASDLRDDAVLVCNRLAWLPLLGLHQPRAVGGASGVLVGIFSEADGALLHRLITCLRARTGSAFPPARHVPFAGLWSGRSSSILHLHRQAG